MSHLVLLGDAVFADQARARGVPDVAACSCAVLPASGRSPLVAFDGTATDEMGTPLGRPLKSATHRVLRP